MGDSCRRLPSLVGCDARVVRRVIPDVHEYVSAIQHRRCSSPHDSPTRHYVTPLNPTSVRTPAVKHAIWQMLLNAVPIKE
jgi:hypothetical protein